MPAPLASTWPLPLRPAALHLPGPCTGTQESRLPSGVRPQLGTPLERPSGKGLLGPGGRLLSWGQAESASRHLHHHSYLYLPSPMLLPLIFSSTTAYVWSPSHQDLYHQPRFPLTSLQLLTFVPSPLSCPAPSWPPLPYLICTPTGCRSPLPAASPPSSAEPIPPPCSLSTPLPPPSSASPTAASPFPANHIALSPLPPSPPCRSPPPSAPSACCSSRSAPH